MTDGPSAVTSGDSPRGVQAVVDFHGHICGAYDLWLNFAWGLLRAMLIGASQSQVLLWVRVRQSFFDQPRRITAETLLQSEGSCGSGAWQVSQYPVLQWASPLRFWLLLSCHSSATGTASNSSKSGSMASIFESCQFVSCPLP